VTDQTTIEDRLAWYWLQAERARFQAAYLKDEKGRQMMLEAARTWDSLAENLKHS
jgi:hypothetical protein